MLSDAEIKHKRISHRSHSPRVRSRARTKKRIEWRLALRRHTKKRANDENIKQKKAGKRKEKKLVQTANNVFLVLRLVKLGT